MCRRNAYTFLVKHLKPTSLVTSPGFEVSKELRCFTTVHSKYGGPTRNEVDNFQDQTYSRIIYCYVITLGRKMKLTIKPIPGRQEKQYAFKCWKKENPNETSMEYHDDQDWNFLYNEKKEIVGSTCSNNLLGDLVLQTVYVYKRYRGQGYMAKIIEAMNPDMIELGKYIPGSEEHQSHMINYAKMGYNQHIVSVMGFKQVGEYVCRRGWRPNPLPEALLGIVHIPIEVINEYKVKNQTENIWVSDVRKSIEDYYNEIQSV